jgi:hypothetical protein
MLAQRLCLRDIDFVQLKILERTLPRFKPTPRFRSEWVDYSAALSARYDESIVKSVLKQIDEYKAPDTNDHEAEYKKSSANRSISRIQEIIDNNHDDGDLDIALSRTSEFLDPNIYPSISRKIIDLIGPDKVHLLHQLKTRAVPPTVWNKIVAAVSGGIDLNLWIKVEPAIRELHPIISQVLESEFEREPLGDQNALFEQEIHRKLITAFGIEKNVDIPRLDDINSYSIQKISLKDKDGKISSRSLALAKKAINKLVKQSDAKFLAQFCSDIHYFVEKFDSSKKSSRKSQTHLMQQINLNAIMEGLARQSMVAAESFDPKVKIMELQQYLSGCIDDLEVDVVKVTEKSPIK